MGSIIYPEIISPVKSLQRGVAVASGTVTISQVNMSKTFVRSFSNGASGIVSVSGSSGGTYDPNGGNISNNGGTGFVTGGGSHPTYSGTRTFTAGATNATSAKFGAYLSSSTTIVIDGPCYWEVVEYI